MKSVLILDEFFAMTAKIRTLFLSHIKITNYLTLKHGTFKLRPDFNFKTEGWTVVSPQNQHLDVYGVVFAPEIFKMGVYLKDERLKKLSEVMFRSCYQLVDEYGSQGEQVTHTNFAQHGDMSNVFKLRGGYSERWTVFWITAHFLTGAAKFAEMNVDFMQ